MTRFVITSVDRELLFQTDYGFLYNVSVTGTLEIYYGAESMSIECKILIEKMIHLIVGLFPGPRSMSGSAYVW